MQETDQTKQIAFSIVAGFGLVAAAIFFGNTAGVNTANSLVERAPVELGADIDPRRGEDVQRNIYGDPEAPITIVEFSDYECPYCGQLHKTLEKVVGDFDGKVNWEYRHLPLPSHRGAVPGAVAAECVARLAGNDAFWAYSNDIFANQRGVTEEFLRTTALTYDISEANYENCIALEEVFDQVREDQDTARALGGSGTPFSVVRYEDGTSRAVSGALPYANWAALLTQ